MRVNPKMFPFNLTVVIYLLICLCQISALLSVCPENCICDIDTSSKTSSSKVYCQNVAEPWDELLIHLPLDTSSLIIHGANFTSLETTDTLPNRYLPDMKHLEISDSYIKTISSTAFFHMPQLEKLHIVNSSVETIEKTCLNVLRDLRILNISDNEISKLDEDVFLDLNELRVLDLHGNNLRYIPTDLNMHLNLSVIDMSENQIEFIHPSSFANLTYLSKLKLHNNNLHILHHSIFSNLSNPVEVTFHSNPWDCSCGLQWLRTELSNDATGGQIILSSPEIITCNFPASLKYKALHTVPMENLTCVEPKIAEMPPSIEILRLNQVTLKCNVSGYPAPSLYWVTPRGVLAKPHHRKYVSADIVRFHAKKSFFGKPTYHESRIAVLDDGSLEIESMRHYFAGEYLCVAENPAGVYVVGFNVTVTTALVGTMVYSVMLGWVTCLSFLVFGIFVGAIRLAAETHCGRKKKYSLDGSLSVDVENGDGGYMFDVSDSDRDSPEFYPSYDVSPIKCTTPAEAEGEYKAIEIANIKETLEDVRMRLRNNMEKSRERIRTRASQIRESSTQYMSSLKENSSTKLHNLKENSSQRLNTLKESSTLKLHTLKENSSQKLQTLKENSTLKLQTLKHSSSQYVHHIRESSSQYAHRVRTGMVLGVEQVKYHMQSIKELCGTGDIGQTISAVSIATNVDSQERTEIVRKVTLL